MSHQDSYKTNIYVLNADGNPLMPCHSQRKARKWLREGKATVACQVPYTLQLTHQIENPGLQPIILGIDPGPNNIGVHAIDEQGRSLLAADTATDNPQVTKHMTKRRDSRHTSRAGERYRRQRRQHKVDASSKKVVYERLLPQCGEPISCKSIRNSKSRYCNRARPEGWLTPTARNLVETHANIAKRFAGLLPVSLVSIEANQFDFTRLKMLDERTWNDVVAPLIDYDSAREYVSARQDGKCLLCDEGIDEYHHVVGRKKNGADTVANLVGLCKECHEHVHKDVLYEQSLLALVPGQEKVFRRLSVLNQAIPYIIATLAGEYDIHVTGGCETARVREVLSLPKSEGSSGHFIDAYCIALSALDGEQDFAAQSSEEAVSSHYHVIRQFRRHDRALIHRQVMRTYKDADGKMVAKNRRKAMGQTGDSLAEYREKHGNASVSRLSCKPSKRSYKDPSRVLPGAVFVDGRGRRHVLTAQSSGGSVLLYDGERFTASRCRIVRRNEGLVFIS